MLRNQPAKVSFHCVIINEKLVQIAFRHVCIHFYVENRPQPGFFFNLSYFMLCIWIFRVNWCYFQHLISRSPPPPILTTCLQTCLPQLNVYMHLPTTIKVYALKAEANSTNATTRDETIPMRHTVCKMTPGHDTLFLSMRTLRWARL